MIYILFAVITYNNNTVTFNHDFTNELDCETAFHNLKMKMGSSKVDGFCQKAKK